MARITGLKKFNLSLKERITQRSVSFVFTPGKEHEILDTLFTENRKAIEDLQTKGYLTVSADTALKVVEAKLDLDAGVADTDFEASITEDDGVDGN